MRRIIFDIEIAKPIEECSNGWESHDEMGISVLCAWEGLSQPMRFFDETTLEKCLAYLDTADVLGGFNTIGFDLPVLTETAHRVLGDGAPQDALAAIYEKPHIDPLDLLIRHEFGCSREDAVARYGGGAVFGGGKKLDDIAPATLGPQWKKSDSGEHAPILFREGRYAELYSYCARDVFIEWGLVKHVLERRYLVWGKDGTKLATDIALPEGV